MEVVTYSLDKQVNHMQESKTTNDINDKVNRRKSDDNHGTAPNSLLALLDDKNKSISRLQQQISNQKLQLGYYLHNILNGPKIRQLSETCTPVRIEENLQLNLAMANFRKHNGVVSPVMRLHTDMTHIEEQILKLAYKQENMIKSILDKPESRSNYIHENSSTLTEILDSTIKLRKDVETFRTCCNRLIVIEDERNALVEQVYSMPVSKRMNCGIFLAAQYEKLRLEKELVEIKREQTIIEQRLVKCEDLDNVHFQNEQANKHYNKILESVSEETHALISTTKKRFEKYQEEIEQLKEDKEILITKNKSFQRIINEKLNSENNLNKMFTNFQSNNVNIIKEMNERIKDVTQERDLYRSKFEQYKDIEQQVKCLRVQLADMDVLRRQRDYFKSQVEDLQEIRAAYSQLVNCCPGVSNLEEETNRIKEENVNIRDVLKQITNDANSLVETATRQCKKYITETEKLRRQNDSLNEDLKVHRQIIDNKTQIEEDLRNWIQELTDDRNKCFRIIEDEKRVSQNLVQETNVLEGQYRNVEHQVMQLELQLEETQKERDYLKMEVKSLHSARVAYLNLVGECPPSVALELTTTNRELNYKLEELQKQHNMKCKEVLKLNDSVEKQMKQIRHLHLGLSTEKRAKQGKRCKRARASLCTSTRSIQICDLKTVKTVYTNYNMAADTSNHSMFSSSTTQSSSPLMISVEVQTSSTMYLQDSQLQTIVKRSFTERFMSAQNFQSTNSLKLAAREDDKEENRSITGRLIKMTSNLNDVLLQPGGKDFLLKTIRSIYGPLCGKG